MSLLLLLFAVFLHVVGDFYLQNSSMSSFKSQSYWKSQYPNDRRQYYFIGGLILHSFVWSFLVVLPEIVYMILHSNQIRYVDSIILTTIVIVNTVIHAILDHIKTNMGKIGTIQDQLLHLGQITLTYIIATIIF